MCSGRSELASLVKLKYEQKSIDGQPLIRHSFSYFVPRSNVPEKTEPEQQVDNNLPNLFQNLRSSTPCLRSSNFRIAAASDLTSGQYIDDLIEDTKTVIEMRTPQATIAMTLLGQDTESCSLPPMELGRFNGIPSH